MSGRARIEPQPTPRIQPELTH
ncbi:MAG: hypothetical protein JWP29_70, partial [Rhodoferax sp.]|nr:hypothetical protein [Rhodoferax sp.]